MQTIDSEDSSLNEKLRKDIQNASDGNSDCVMEEVYVFDGSEIVISQQLRVSITILGSKVHQELL